MNRRNLLKLIPVTIISLLGISKSIAETKEPFLYTTNGVDFDIKYIKEKRWDVILKALDSASTKPNAKRIKIEATYDN